MSYSSSMRFLGKPFFRRIRTSLKVLPLVWALFAGYAGLALVGENAALTSHRVQHVLASATTPASAPLIDTPCPLCDAFLSQSTTLRSTTNEAPFEEAIVGYESITLPLSFPRAPLSACARGPPRV